MIERRPLETERLRLVPVHLGLAERMWRAAEASLHELRRWLVWAETATLDSTRAYAADAERQWSAGAGYQFVVLEDGEVAGGIGLDLRGMESPGPKLAELGYWIRSDRAGRGLATEAGRAVVGFGFDTVGLYRIELRAGRHNEPSQRVAENLGFQREALLRRGCPLGESGYDCYLYGLLATDPRA